MGGYRNFGGGFGGGFNMQQLMKQAQKMQEGDKKIVSLTIKQEIVDPDDVEMLQDLVIAAVNDCVSQIEKVEKENGPGALGLM